MSDKPRPYDLRYIQAWTVLSLALGLVLFCMFVFGDTLLQVGHITWALLRWLARGII
jgi:hypothetical protein